MYSSVTSEQLVLINRYTPASMPPVEAEEVVSVTFIATDNLLTRSLGKWSEEDLDAIARLLPGLPFTLDHDWSDVAKSQGIVYDARVIRSTTAPAGAMDRAGNSSQNQEIVKREGYITVEADVAFPVTSPVLSGLKFGLIGNVSLGGFVYSDVLCPICKTSFDDKHCPHYVPDRGWGAESDENVAPYFIRQGVYDLGELSIVLIPNIPAAGVVKKSM